MQDASGAFIYEEDQQVTRDSPALLKTKKLHEAPAAKKQRHALETSPAALEQASVEPVLQVFVLLLEHYPETANPWDTYSLHTLGRVCSALHTAFTAAVLRFQATKHVPWARFAFGGLLKQTFTCPPIPQPPGPVLSRPPLLDLAERRFDPVFQWWVTYASLEATLQQFCRIVEWASLHGATRWFCEYMTACLASSQISCATIHTIKADNYKEYDHPLCNRMLHAAMSMDNWRIFGVLVSLFALLYNRPLSLEFASTLRCFPEQCFRMLRGTSVRFTSYKVIDELDKLVCSCAANRSFVWGCLAFQILPRFQHPAPSLVYQGNWKPTPAEFSSVLNLFDGSQFPLLEVIPPFAWHALRNASPDSIKALVHRVVQHLHDTDTLLSQRVDQYFSDQFAAIEKELAYRLVQLDGRSEQAAAVRCQADLAKVVITSRLEGFTLTVLRLPELVSAFNEVLPMLSMWTEPHNRQRLEDIVRLMNLPQPADHYAFPPEEEDGDEF